MIDSNPRRLSIEDLEKLLDDEEEAPIEILPNGMIVQRRVSAKKKKVLTFRENLGGEYGHKA